MLYCVLANLRKMPGMSCVSYAVLFSTVGCTDPTVLVCGNGHWFSCPTHSTITRLPSGSSISHSAHFRYPALSVGVGTAHGCTRRVGGTSAHPHSATACRVRRSFAHPGAYAVAWLGSEYLPQALRLASAPIFAIPPSTKALAPWIMHLVRPRC